MQSTAESERKNRILDWFAKAKRTQLPKDFIYAGADLHGALEYHDRLVVTATVPGKAERFAIPEAHRAEEENVEALVRAAVSWIGSMLAQPRRQ